MKIRKTCYGQNDIKIICNKCGQKFFSSSPKPELKVYVQCPNCLKCIEIDFSEDKEWYGGHDGKSDIYDCFYLGNCSSVEYEELKQNLIRVFGNEIKFEDASDGIHGTRLAITLREVFNTYYKEIIKNGLTNISFNFNLLCHMEGQKVKEIIEELKEEEKVNERL